MANADLSRRIHTVPYGIKTRANDEAMLRMIAEGGGTGQRGVAKRVDEHRRIETWLQADRNRPLLGNR